MELSTILIYIFSVIGILDTLYLVHHKIKGTDVACLFFPDEWCRKVQYAPQSKTFGIPNPVAGLIMYSAIFVLMILYGQGLAPFVLLQIIIAVGFLFSLYFMFVQGFKLKAFCTWCVVSFINFTVMAVAAFILY